MFITLQTSVEQTTSVRIKATFLQQPIGDRKKQASLYYVQYWPIMIPSERASQEEQNELHSTFQLGVMSTDKCKCTHMVKVVTAVGSKTL